MPVAKVTSVAAARKSTGPQVLTIHIDNIKNKFDVRQALDEDRIVYLAEVYQSGVYVEPIKVIKDGPDTTPGEQLYAFVDGRHRAAARNLLDLPTIEAILVTNIDDDLVSLYAESLKSNYGGAKPPTREDIRHTVTRMLEAGAKHSRIMSALSFIPPSMMRQYLTDAMAKLARHRVFKALEWVANGGSLKEAAEKYQVDVEVLKNEITGSKKKKKAAGTIVGEYKAYLTITLRKANQGIAGKIQSLLAKIEDGEVTVDVGIDIINQWRTHVVKSEHRIKDWEQRLQHIAEGLGKTGLPED
jgi:hypothetical protein